MVACYTPRQSLWDIKETLNVHVYHTAKGRTLEEFCEHLLDLHKDQTAAEMSILNVDKSKLRLGDLQAMTLSYDIDIGTQTFSHCMVMVLHPVTDLAYVIGHTLLCDSNPSVAPERILGRAKLEAIWRTFQLTNPTQAPIVQLPMDELDFRSFYCSDYHFTVDVPAHWTPEPSLPAPLVLSVASEHSVRFDWEADQDKGHPRRINAEEDRIWKVRFVAYLYPFG